MALPQQKLRAITWTVTISAIIALIAWDIFDKVEDPSGVTTISWQTWTAACSRPIIAFFAGVLCGHLFWQTPSEATEKQCPASPD